MPVLMIRTDRVAEQFVGSLRRRFRSAVVALMATVVVSTLGFVYLSNDASSLGWRLFDGLWKTLNLVSTVGSLGSPMTDAQRAWSIVVIIIGLGAVIYGFGTMQGLIHSGDVLRYARKRMQRTLRDMNNHIVLCGYGSVGRAVAAQIRKTRIAIVVVDVGEEAVAAADEDGLLAVQADATDEKTLRQAGVDRAQGVIAALHTDAAVVYLTLVARELNPDLRIVALASRKDVCPALVRAGADRVIVPGEIAAMQLSHLILKAHVTEFVAAALGEGEYDFAELAVVDLPGLAGHTLGELQLPERAEMIVIAVVDESGGQSFNPGQDRQLRMGDTLIIVCRADGLERLRQLEL